MNINYTIRGGEIVWENYRTDNNFLRVLRVNNFLRVLRVQHVPIVLPKSKEKK